MTRRQPMKTPARLLLLLPAFAGLGAMAADGDAERVGNTREVLQQWVETRRLISRERRDWTIGREALKDRIDLVQREIDSLRGKIDDANASIAEADQKRAELVEANEALKTASASLDGVVTSLEQRTRSLLKRLPDPLRDRLKPLSQQIPDDPDDTDLSMSQRFQNVVGLLNEVNRFNRQITVTSEVRTLPDGTAAEVTALYVGIGQGYYASGNGRLAGVGTASADGWAWTPSNEAAPAVAHAIAILKNEQVAEFVQLPVHIQ